MLDRLPLPGESAVVVKGKAHRFHDIWAASYALAQRLTKGRGYRVTSQDPLVSWVGVLATLLAEAKLVLDPAGAFPQLCPAGEGALEGIDALLATAFDHSSLPQDWADDMAQSLAQRLQATTPQLGLATSGSTGEPTLVWKSWQVLTAEALDLMAFYPWQASSDPLVSLVPPVHIYGLLHSILLPLLSGRPVVQLGDVTLGLCPNEQKFLAGKTCALLIATPASWARARELIAALPIAAFVSSAGSFGQQRQRQLLEVVADSPRSITAVEIYGSTETGGIAWQDLLSCSGFRPFPSVDLSCDEHGDIAWVTSPYLYPAGRWLLQDRLEPCAGGFRVLGRKDMVFKYGGQRHSLSAVAQQLAQAAEVSVDQVVCDFQWGSEGPKGGVLWGFVELPELASDIKERFLAEQSCKGIRLPFPDAVVAIPKLPRTPLGKVSLKALRALRQQHSP